jgi:D-lactate dehydrogenase
MRMAVFSTQEFERQSFDKANARFNQELIYFGENLHRATAPLAAGCPAICAFVNDKLDGPTLSALAAGGTRLVALRSAGYNHVDLASAEKLKMTVMRVPAYSPQAVAEHAVALMLTLNRNIHRAYNRVREGNFDLCGLVGFDIAGKTVGIVGTGKIGAALARIMKGFDCRLVGYDTYKKSGLFGAGHEVQRSPVFTGGIGHCFSALSAHAGNDPPDQRQIDFPHEAWINADQHRTGSADRNACSNRRAKDARSPLVSRDRRL